MEAAPFDWHNMLLGSQPPLFLLEIALRTAVMFIYLLVAARFIGKRALAELTPFEFIVVVALGSAAGDPMFYPEVPLLHGAVVITVIVALERALQAAVARSRRVHDSAVGDPVLIIRDGQLVEPALRSERLNEDDVLMQLRLEGIRDTGEVELAYLEHSGKLSIFKAPEARRFRSTLPGNAT
jgi:uncharacterized membrane protein YcaP (DUF421 family)